MTIIIIFIAGIITILLFAFDRTEMRAIFIYLLFVLGMFALLKTPDYDCIMNCLGFIDVLMVEFGVAGRDYVPEHVMDLLEGLQYHEGEVSIFFKFRPSVECS